LYCSAAGRTQLSKFASFPMLAPLPPIVHQQGAARERRQAATHPFELPLGPPPTAAAPGAMWTPLVALPHPPQLLLPQPPLQMPQAASALRARCPWSEDTATEAASQGHLEALQWAREHGCPWSEKTTAAAAAGGFLEILR